MDKSIIEQEIKYLVEVLGKRLINGDETSSVNGYVQLAKKYWPEEFERAKNSNYKVEVHHIDFDHSNNVISNLVVLSISEHRRIHYMFDPTFKNMVNNRNKGHFKKHKPHNRGQNNPSYGKHWNVVNGHRVYKEQ